MTSSDVATFENVGKILIVDDKYDEAIEAAVTTLVQSGMSVQYWNGKGNFPEMIRNVRVVVLDLALTGLEDRLSGPGFYYSAAQALNKIPGPFLVVIMSVEFNEDDPSNLEDAYKGFFDSPICGFISKTGLKRADELDDPKRIAEIIVSSIADKTTVSYTHLTLPTKRIV